MKGRNRGFTLLELLVAVALLSLVAAMAYGGLSSLVASKQAVEEHGKRLADLQLALQLLQNDLVTALPRSSRDILGDVVPAMRWAPERQELAFTRLGPDLPPGAVPRSRLEWVSYRLQGGEWSRTRWRYPDRLQATPADTQPVLDDLDGLQLRFLDKSGEWHNQWPPGDADYDVLPAALELAFVHPGYGELRRVLLVQP